MAGGTLLGVIGAPFAKKLPLGKLSGLLFLIGGLFWSASDHVNPRRLIDFPEHFMMKRKKIEAIGFDLCWLYLCCS
jgi:hypothetical protein